MVDSSRVKSILESLIFVSVEPVSAGRMARIVEGVGRKQLDELLDELVQEYADSDRGIVIERVAEGLQFRTRAENAEWVRRLVKTKPPRLTKAMIETLAIAAYNQPTTAPEIESIRGVDCSSALKSLLERGLLKIIGRKDAPGKPLLYGTTGMFLEAFGLPDLGHLPSLREITELLEGPAEKELIAKTDLKEEDLAELTRRAKSARAGIDKASIESEQDEAASDEAEESDQAEGSELHEEIEDPSEEDEEDIEPEPD